MRYASFDLVTAVCDHFVAMQNSYGRPDPDRTPFASTPDRTPWIIAGYITSSPHLHSPPMAALALYKAGRKLNREDYVRAADLYMLYLLAATRDPFGDKLDSYSEEWVQALERKGSRYVLNSRSILGVSFQYGMALDALCRGFMATHPNEVSFHSKAAALYDWLQHFRTNRGPYFKLGYGGREVEGQQVDGATSDDLGLVGRGLASYYTVSRRREVLDDLVGLAGYFLRAHRYNSDDGCFSEEVGSWVIGPWPLKGAGEHMLARERRDKQSWGYSVREAVDFLTRLYSWIEDEQIRKLTCDRTTRGMKWVFDKCQFEDGAIGMFQRDDAFTGMAAAGILDFLDCRNAGFLNDNEGAEYGRKAQRAMDWILSWSPDALIKEAGHKYVNGGVTLFPPENLAWMLAWTVEALLRIEEL